MSLPLSLPSPFYGSVRALNTDANAADRLCWEQNVHVIVMLTREIEGSTVKCGKYWEEGSYGPLRLKLLETNDTPERERRRRESEMASGFFNVPQARAAAADSDEHTIRRVFELTHTGYPAAPPRTVSQLQYLDWPDLDVPKDPRGLLDKPSCIARALSRIRCASSRCLRLISSASAASFAFASFWRLSRSSPSITEPPSATALCAETLNFERVLSVDCLSFAGLDFAN